ncbi:MAG TPA: glycoside hydrolase family 6 protein, partial [Polyangia bacterium]|nr:glycoside hydrolase family 6 protein [Polyangia bacterium]
HRPRRTTLAPLLLCAPLLLAAAPARAKDPNPFAGARLYTNPDFTRMIETLAAKTPAQAPALRKLGAQQTAVWLDSVKRVPSVARHLDEARRQQAVPVFVVYDLPGRDCAAKASSGEFSVKDEGRYQHEFIDAIAAAFRAHPSQPVAVILEPDSLANLATNLSLDGCAAAEGAYRRGIAYAISKLSLPNVSIYLDAAHGGWLGWKRNRTKIATIFKGVLEAAGGSDKIRGFAVNVSNYNPTKVPGFHRQDLSNPGPDELSYIDDLRQELAEVGIPDKGFVIDTGRNGKLGIRANGANWCNIAHAGLGERPRVAPVDGVDAYLWIKPPGESDGVADPRAPRFDSNCASTEALPGAPQAGELFVPYLLELVKNANPPL